VAAHDEIERALALADAALPHQEHAESEDVDEDAMARLARREAIFKERRQPRDRRGRRERRSHERHARAFRLGRELRRTVQAHGHHHAGKVAREQAPQDLRAQGRLHALDEANFALTEHQHAAGSEVLVEARQREPGLLDVRQRDAAVEAGGARQQIEVEAGGGAPRAEQGSDGHAARHDQASGSISP
jgi:hypothetical protein